MNDKQSVVASVGKSGYATTLSSGTHKLVADEPLAVGGTDQGPTPYGYLCSALGACTAITLRMYADRKGLPLDGVTVHVTHSRIDATDCADCETKSGKVDQIERVITLHGALSPEQRGRLLEIANHCPVHRTLTSEIKVRSRLAE